MAEIKEFNPERQRIVSAVRQAAKAESVALEKILYEDTVVNGLLEGWETKTIIDHLILEDADREPIGAMIERARDTLAVKAEPPQASGEVIAVNFEADDDNHE